MATFAQIQEEIANMLDIPEEELDGEQKKALDQYLDELGSQEAAKVDSFAQFVKFQTDRAKACREESARLTRKARAMENNLARLKNHYKFTMENRGLKKVSGDVYVLSLRKSESVLTPDTEAELKRLNELYPAYIHEKIEYSPDRKLLKEALKAGAVIPGCSLQESFSLQIR